MIFSHLRLIRLLFIDVQPQERIGRHRRIPVCRGDDHGFTAF